ncbi:MAG TPA: hypothetical protein VGL70_08835 [Candidatus Binatia bacterium]|jgi:hypothetical protein
MKSLKVGRRILAAGMFVVMMSFLAGCFAYIDHDHHYRRGYYRDYRR